MTGAGGTATVRAPAEAFMSSVVGGLVGQRLLRLGCQHAAPENHGVQGKGRPKAMMNSVTLNTSSGCSERPHRLDGFLLHQQGVRATVHFNTVNQHHHGGQCWNRPVRWPRRAADRKRCPGCHLDLNRRYRGPATVNEFLRGKRYVAVSTQVVGVQDHLGCLSSNGLGVPLERRGLILRVSTWSTSAMGHDAKGRPWRWRWCRRGSGLIRARNPHVNRVRGKLRSGTRIRQVEVAAPVELLAKRHGVGGGTLPREISASPALTR